MPEGTKVGNAFIDTSLQLNDSSVERLRRKVKAEFNKFSVGIKIHPDQSSVAAFGKKLDTELKKQKVGVKVNIDQASLKRAQVQMAALTRTVTKTVRIKTEIDLDRTRALKQLDKLIPSKKRVEVEAHVDNNRVSRVAGGMGHLFGRHLSEGVAGVLSLMPARLEQLFTKTGPIAGTAFIAAFGAALVIGMPALGAMVTGAFIASLGIGAAIGAAVVGAAKDPRVAAAGKRLSDNFMNKIVFDPRMQNLGAVLAKQLDRVNAALNRWAPHIQNILQAGAKHLPKIVTGLIGMVDGFLPALDRLENSKFMVGLMDVLANGLKKIGEAFGVSFDKILNDPQAMAGATKGLDDFFNIIAGGIKTIFDFIFWLSKMWEKLNAKGQNGKSPLDKMRETWKNIKDVLDDLANSTIVPVLGMIKGAFDKLKGPLEDSVGLLKKLSDWLDNKDHQKNIATVAKLLVGLKIAMFGYAAGLRAAAAAQAVFAAAGGFGAIGGKGGVKGAGKAGGLGILGSLLLGGDLQQTAGAAAGGAVGGPLGAIIGAALGTAVSAGIKAANPAVHAKMNEFWNALLKGEWNKAWQAWIAGSVVPQFTALKNLFNTAWGAIKSAFSTTAQQLKTGASSLGASLRGAFNTSLSFIRNQWATSWNWVQVKAFTVWNSISAFVSGWWTNLKNWYNNSLRFIKGVWGSAWGFVKQTAFNQWTAINHFIRSVFTGIATFISGKLNAIRAGWGAVWANVFGIVRQWWTNIRNIVAALFNATSNFISARLNSIRNTWRGVWSNIHAILSTIWNQMSGMVRARFDAVRGFINNRLAAIRKTWNDVWNGMHAFLGGVWNKISGAVRNGINAVLGVIQKGINIINGALSKLGVGFRIPPITQVAAPSPGLSALAQNKARKNRAGGGSVWGRGTGTSDSIPANLSNGEFVIKAQSARSIGYNRLDRMNREGALGYAGGGRVGPANNSLLNEHRNHVHVAMMQGINYIIGLAKKSGFPAHPTSTYRPGDPLWHGKGKAVDFGGFNQDGLASYFLNIPGVMELIHRTNKRDYAIFGGKGGGGGGGGLFGFLGRGWNWVLDHILRPAGNKATDLLPESNGMMAMGKGWMKAMMNQVINKAKIEFDQAQKTMDASQSGGDGGGNAFRWSGTVMQALKMLHLPASWLGPTLKLIGRESGGNPRAINNWDSNAKKGTPSKGLMQTIGPTFEANKYPGYNNIYGPLDNILAGLRYIQRRYGSIFRVQQATGATPRGYDYGGVMPPGTLGYNAGRKPEMVLNPAQGAALQRNIEGSGRGDVYATVKIGDEVIADRVKLEVSRNNELIITDLNRGY